MVPNSTGSNATGSKGLVVFIHGFMGNPSQFSKFEAFVNDHGFESTSLLLPGHGGPLREFSKSTAAQWQGYVLDQVRQLAQSYGEVWLAGHSMGGLLALNAAIELESSVSGVCVIASPFKLALFSAKANKTRLRYIFYRGKNPIKTALMARTGIRFSPRVVVRIIKPFRELRRLMRSTRAVLPRVRKPVTAVYSHSDELSAFASLGILKSGLSGAPLRELVLTDSLHALFPDNEQAQIEQALLELLERAVV